MNIIQLRHRFEQHTQLGMIDIILKIRKIRPQMPPVVFL